MARKRAMSSEQASRKKREGHKNEEVFAELIGGQVNKGTQTDKKDVIDCKHRSHSVKGGTWWQVFLYGRARFETNTTFRGTGCLAEILIACIDAFPEDRTDYEADKIAAKTRLQAQMRALCAELQKPEIFPAFLSKTLFNGGEVNYLSVLPPAEYTSESDKIFHVFSQEDVVNVLSSKLEIANSVARQAGQMDDQKVIFKVGKGVGEIEIRTDSKAHYRQAKCRFNGPLIAALLRHELRCRQLTPQVYAFGTASRSLKWLMAIENSNT